MEYSDIQDFELSLREFLEGCLILRRRLNTLLHDVNRMGGLNQKEVDRLITLDQKIVQVKEFLCNRVIKVTLRGLE